MYRLILGIATSVVFLTTVLPAVAQAPVGPPAVDSEPTGMLGKVYRTACEYGPFNCSGLKDPNVSGLRRAAQIGGIIIGSLLAFLGIVFLVLMIYSGIRWMTARGNEQEVEQAKKTIINTSIGLMIVVLAYALVMLASAIVTRIGLLK